MAERHTLKIEPAMDSKQYTTENINISEKDNNNVLIYEIFSKSIKYLFETLIFWRLIILMSIQYGSFYDKKYILLFAFPLVLYLLTRKNNKKIFF